LASDDEVRQAPGPDQALFVEQFTADVLPLVRELFTSLSFA
jgi:hypothetical protein